MSTKVGTNGVPGLCYAEMERGTEGEQADNDDKSMP